jgi:gas vesicle protein
MGSAMGKTIALKLTEKEDQIIRQLNKQGISNSELLRTALRQYFEYLHESISQYHQEERIPQINESNLPTIRESLEGLKEEVVGLREQTKRTKEQIESDIVNLQNQLHQLSISTLVTKQTREPIKAIIGNDIHNEIDEFLKKRLYLEDLWRR